MKTKGLLSLCIGCLAALLVLILAGTGSPVSQVQAATMFISYYVDAATGSDNNDCISPTTACLTVTMAISKATAGDNIQIAAGVYPESIEISQPLTVTGAGPDATFLDGGDTGRVVSTWNNTVTLANLTVRNGRVGDPGNGNIFDNSAGGIFNHGTLILQNVHVLKNTALSSGGGVFNAGTLTVIDSKIGDNHSDGSGGGLATWYGSTTTISHSYIYSNTGHQGGGLYNLSRFDVYDSAIVDNRATNANGGGLLVFSGTITLERVTLADNEAASFGGGISNQLGTLNLINSTVSGNRANQHGGLDNGGTGETLVLNSTIADNTASGAGTQIGGVGNTGTISLQNSIVAQNQGRNCRPNGTWISLGYNLSNSFDCDLTHSNDQSNTPANLAPLASYNSDFIEIHGLLPGSGAIDRGSNANCPAIDQRGVARPVDGDGDGPATCDIGAFEVRQQIAVNDVIVTEGTNLTTTALFTVSLFPTSNQTVTVNYATAADTALADGDFTAQSGTVTFAPGQTAQPIAVEIIGDAVDEPDETFFLNLSNATHADLIDGQAVGTIIDNDGNSALTVSDVTVNESDRSQTIAYVTVTLSPVSTEVVTVSYSTHNGTAQADADYEPASGTLVFASGEISKTVEVVIAGDNVDEGVSESFTLQLTNPINATLTDNEALITILDNDAANLSLRPGPSIIEGNSGTSTATFTVTLNMPTAFTVSVAYTTTVDVVGNPATPNEDYEPQAGSLIFQPGETVKPVSITIFGDTTVEADEHFSLRLSNASPVPLSANVSTGFILNDDEGQSSIYLPVMFRP